MRGRDQGLTGRLSARLRANLTMKTGRLSTRLLALPDTVCGCIHPGRSGSQLGSRQLTKIDGGGRLELLSSAIGRRSGRASDGPHKSFQGFCSPVRNQNTSLTPSWMCRLPPEPTTGLDSASSGVYAGIPAPWDFQIRAYSREIGMVQDIEDLRRNCKHSTSR